MFLRKYQQLIEFYILLPIVSSQKKPSDEVMVPLEGSVAPLNFKALFSDQPAADYFPVTPWSRPATRAGTVPSDFEMNASAVNRVLEKKVDISSLPPPTRLNTAPSFGKWA